MTLRDRLVGSCGACKGTGYVDDTLCACMRKFRAYNRLSGFSEQILDFCTEGYTFPRFDKGQEFVEFFLDNSETVVSKGLSLFLFSSERGRGKTTLAHRLVYELAYDLQQTEKYDRTRTYGFDRSSELFEKLAENSAYDGWKSSVYVLDDLANESMESPWRREVVLSQLQRILHYRRDNKLVTIITTNFPPSAISARYSGLLDSLLEISDGKIGGQVFRGVEVGGAEDLRLVSTDWPI